MVRTCDYVNFLPDGTKTTCVNKYQLREILFRNPEYKSQDVNIHLCNAHYLEVFGEWELKNQQLQRLFLNTKLKYFKDFAKAKKYAEYFNEYDYKKMNWHKIEDALRKWQHHKYESCAYDLCDVKLNSVKHVFQIIIDKPSGMFDKKLRTCSKGHWKKFIYQTGVERPLNPNKKQKTIINLDAFSTGVQHG